MWGPYLLVIHRTGSIRRPPRAQTAPQLVRSSGWLTPTSRKICHFQPWDIIGASVTGWRARRSRQCLVPADRPTRSQTGMLCWRESICSTPRRVVNSFGQRGFSAQRRINVRCQVQRHAPDRLCDYARFYHHPASRGRHSAQAWSTWGSGQTAGRRSLIAGLLKSFPKLLKRFQESLKNPLTCCALPDAEAGRVSNRPTALAWRGHSLRKTLETR